MIWEAGSESHFSVVVYITSESIFHEMSRQNPKIFWCADYQNCLFHLMYLILSQKPETEGKTDYSISIYSDFFSIIWIKNQVHSWAIYFSIVYWGTATVETQAYMFPICIVCVFPFIHVRNKLYINNCRQMP